MRSAGQVAMLATMLIAVTITTLISGDLAWPGWMLGIASTIALVGPRLWPPQLVLSAGITASTLAAFAFSALAVGLSLPFGAIVALVTLLLLTMLMTITISGWGLCEGAAAALLPLAGAVVVWSGSGACARAHPASTEPHC